MDIVHCPVCNVRLFDCSDRGGKIKIKIKCGRCKSLILFDGEAHIVKKIDSTYRAEETKAATK